MEQRHQTHGNANQGHLAVSVYLLSAENEGHVAGTAFQSGGEQKWKALSTLGMVGDEQDVRSGSRRKKWCPMRRECGGYSVIQRNRKD